MLICINKIFKINVSVVRDVRQMFGLSSSLQLSWSVRVFVRNCLGLRLLCPGLVRRCTFAFPSKGISSPRFQFWEKVSSLAVSAVTAFVQRTKWRFLMWNGSLAMWCVWSMRTYLSYEWSFHEHSYKLK